MCPNGVIRDDRHPSPTPASSSQGSHVFAAPGGHRRRLFRLIVRAGLGCFALWLSAVIAALAGFGELPGVPLPQVGPLDHDASRTRVQEPHAPGQLRMWDDSGAPEALALARRPGDVPALVPLGSTVSGREPTTGRRQFSPRREVTEVEVRQPTPRRGPPGGGRKHGSPAAPVGRPLPAPVTQPMVTPPANPAPARPAPEPGGSPPQGRDKHSEEPPRGRARRTGWDRKEADEERPSGRSPSRSESPPARSETPAAPEEWDDDEQDHGRARGRRRGRRH
jgi:hypothetical protein